MDYQKEKEKKQRTRNSINQIGNIFLNMYYKGLEKQKIEKEGKENDAKLNKSLIFPKNEVEKSESKRILQKIEESKKTNDIQKNTFSINIPEIKKIKTMKLTKNELNRFLHKDSNKKDNFDKKTTRGKENDFNIYSPIKDRSNNSKVKIDKKLTLTSIKRAMKNYYMTHLDLIDNKTK